MDPHKMRINSEGDKLDCIQKEQTTFFFQCALQVEILLNKEYKRRCLNGIEYILASTIWIINNIRAFWIRADNYTKLKLENNLINNQMFILLYVAIFGISLKLDYAHLPLLLVKYPNPNLMIGFQDIIYQLNYMKKSWLNSINVLKYWKWATWNWLVAQELKIFYKRNALRLWISFDRFIIFTFLF